MNSKNLTYIIVFVILLLPAVSSAQFKPLVGIPGITDPNANFNTYINALYALSISIAGLLAVIKIIIAGVKWMLSDVVTSKQEAKSDIQGALIGLLIVISAFLILNVINPQLTQSKLFTPPVDPAPKTSAASKAGAGAPAPSGTNLIKSASYFTVASCTALGGTVSGGYCINAKIGSEATCKANGGAYGSSGGTCSGMKVTDAPPAASSGGGQSVTQCNYTALTAKQLCKKQCNDNAALAVGGAVTIKDIPSLDPAVGIINCTWTSKASQIPN